jgi:hypothetical protein
MNDQEPAGLPPEFDLISYAGQITRAGYEKLCDELAAKKKSSVALLVLTTPGGDPHAGFRIARALGHCYDHFDALVPRYCKSAGTLIVIGARTIYMDDMSELGPLDIQVKKGDEIIGQNSGLEFMKAVSYLQTQSMAAFRNHLLELTQETGLSTRVASDIAARLTCGLFEPIAAQIDPLKLAEMQRATEIAFEYGTRLAEKSKNLRPFGLAKLVANYPSHSFVIDRKEATKLFVDVRSPTGHMSLVSRAFRDAMLPHIDSTTPLITIQNVVNTPVEKFDDQAAPNVDGTARSDEDGRQPVNGDRQGVEQGHHPDAGASPHDERAVAGDAEAAAAAAANDASGPSAGNQGVNG